MLKKNSFFVVKNLKGEIVLAFTDISPRFILFLFCYRSYFESEPSMTEEAILVQDHISLLERQRPIEVT